MKSSAVATTLATATFSLLLLAPGAAARGSHTNKEVGYKIRTPKDFVEASTGLRFAGFSTLFEDPYVVDSFEAKRALPNKKGWLNALFKLQMITLYFPERSAAEVAKAREDALKGGAADGTSVAVVSSSNKLYLSFEEYAKDRITGFFFENEKRTKVAGHEATLYEMKFEKLANIPQRWMACSYKIPGGEFAVMFSCTEDAFDDYKSDFRSSFKSFRMIDKAGLNSQSLVSSTTIERDDIDESELSAEEIVERRRMQKEEAFKACLDSLPKGWRSFETDNFLVVYDCPPKYAKTVGKQAEGVIDWLEEHFAAVGSGVVQSGILRVFPSESDVVRDDEWLQNLLGNVFGGKGRVREIRFGRPDSRGWTSEFDELSRAVVRNWFAQKNDELWNRMPAWLESGLMEYVEDAEMDGSRLSFKTDEWEKDTMVEAKNAQKKYEGSSPEQAPLKPIKLLMQMPRGELYSGMGRQFATAQCSSLVRYLLEGPGARNKKTKMILPHYVGHLYDLVEEVEARLKKEKEAEKADKGAEAEMSEEERLKAEDEEYKKRREQAYTMVADEILAKAFERTFRDWSDSDWSTLDSSWNKFAEGRTR